jgi:hypothetical protein
VVILTSPTMTPDLRERISWTPMFAVGSGELRSGIEVVELQELVRNRSEV